MCRNCPMPEWGDPVTCRVADLPAFFAKQISWNFERLNFGNATVVDTQSGRPERPTVTAKVGCRLKDNIKSEGTGRVPERYLLVSEVLYCPGKRYGCTPRENCTGKRRNCWAQCKITIYADQDDIAYVCYSGSHGTGNVEDVSRHRPLPAVMREVKRQRVEGGATPGETVQWIKKFVEERGISTEDARFVLKESQLKSLVKRMSKGEVDNSNQREADNYGDEETTTEQLTENNIEENTENWQDTQAVSPSTETSYTDGGGFKSTEEKESDSSMTEKHGESSTVDLSEGLVAASPLNTPLTSGPPTPVESSKVFREGELFLSNLFTTPQTAIANQLTAKKDMTMAVTFVATPSRRGCQTIPRQTKNDEIERLKHHVHILEQENLNKISQVAQLEVQVKLLQQVKQGDLEKIKKELNKMKEDNNRKSARITELEKMVQIAYAALKQREIQVIATDNPQVSNNIEKTSNHGNMIVSVALTNEKTSELATDTS